MEAIGALFRHPPKKLAWRLFQQTTNRLGFSVEPTGSGPRYHLHIHAHNGLLPDELSDVKFTTLTPHKKGAVFWYRNTAREVGKDLSHYYGLSADMFEAK
ncbi:hypothetical protein SAMD00023353_1501230 [Rosellinia necatrix]|uniref:Uncharacterized protein n=1 Tax=Rosellinia necatrix TaxID=77044 RepID=A0A1W2TIV4_ROSNE|nr:hypothetical protein SAMD00023353_1501230 [Rosellinia necatrix]